MPLRFGLFKSAAHCYFFVIPNAGCGKDQTMSSLFYFRPRFQSVFLKNVL